MRIPCYLVTHKVTLYSFFLQGYLMILSPLSHCLVDKTFRNVTFETYVPLLNLLEVN